jgi:hypothetical protein
MCAARAAEKPTGFLPIRFGKLPPAGKGNAKNQLTERPQVFKQL